MSAASCDYNLSSCLKKNLFLFVSESATSWFHEVVQFFFCETMKNCSLFTLDVQSSLSRLVLSPATVFLPGFFVLGLFSSGFCMAWTMQNLHGDLNPSNGPTLGFGLSVSSPYILAKVRSI